MRLLRVAESASTNDDLTALAARGAPHGTALLADRQTAGRGRLGRVWESGEGNVALSVLLRPDLPLERVPLLCLAAAVAVATAAGPAYRIKWPNDVLAPDDRKVCGILAELDSERGQVRHVVVGIGVNLASAPPLPTAASLLEVDGIRRDPEAFAREVAEGLIASCEQLQEDPSPVLQRWRALSHTLGREVEVAGVVGRALDIDPDGALRLLTECGERRVLAGDVTMVAQQSG